jgi:hypothetical protein
VTPTSPSIPEAKRLETLRLEQLNGMSLAEFHRRLTASGDYRISYAAVRNYHTNRKAPVDYYARVSRVFDVRLEWLLFGDGEMTPPLQMARDSRGSTQEWADALPAVAPTIWSSTDPVSQAAFLECLRRLDLARPGTRALNRVQKESLARVLDTLVGGALWILRGDRRIPRDFVRHMLLALAHGIPEPGKGSTYRGIVKRMKLEEGAR